MTTTRTESKLFPPDTPDETWAQAFVGCEIEGTGRRFNETVAVLVKKLAAVRLEALKWSLPEKVNPHRVTYDQQRVILEIERLAAIQEGEKP